MDAQSPTDRELLQRILRQLEEVNRHLVEQPRFTWPTTPVEPFLIPDGIGGWKRNPNSPVIWPTDITIGDICLDGSS